MPNSCVLFDLTHLVGGDGIEDRKRTVGSRDAVVDGADGEVGTADFEAALAQAFEGLGRRHFVDHVQIDVDEAGRAGFFVDYVVVPDLSG